MAIRKEDLGIISEASSEALKVVLEKYGCKPWHTVIIGAFIMEYGITAGDQDLIAQPHDILLNDEVYLQTVFAGGPKRVSEFLGTLTKLYLEITKESPE